jgi:hypothetical protein
MTAASTDVTGNRQLAGRARDMADRSGLRRRAWLCVSVALAETRTVTAARAALADIPVTEVRDLAAQLLEQLATELPPGEPSPGASDNAAREPRCG